MVLPGVGSESLTISSSTASMGVKEEQVWDSVQDISHPKSNHFRAGRGKWAWSRIIDLGSTSIREVIGKNMVPGLCMFSFRRLLRMRGGGGGEGGANRRNGSELRVAGSADGNSDLLRVTRRKLSCGILPLEQLEALKTDTMGLMATILAEPQSDPAQLTKARTL